MISVALFAALLAPNEQAVQAIVTSATADWGRLHRRTMASGEVWLEGARQGRAATYRFDESGELVMLAVTSPCGRPFPDREGLAALVVRSLDPSATPRRIRFVAGMLSYDWGPLSGNMAIRIGNYVVVGHRIGGSACDHNYLSIERAPPGGNFREAPL